MKWEWAILVLVLCAVTAVGQEARPASATYSQNGVLIGLSGLSPLKDCSIRAMEGRAKAVKQRGGIVSFDLKSKDRRMTFRFALSRLGPLEQGTYQNDFLHKGLKLRASGYACKGDDEALDAVSIERAY